MSVLLGAIRPISDHLPADGQKWPKPEKSKNADLGRGGPFGRWFDGYEVGKVKSRNDPLQPSKRIFKNCHLIHDSDDTLLQIATLFDVCLVYGQK